MEFSMSALRHERPFLGCLFLNHLKRPEIEFWFAATQLAMQTEGKYEIICAKLIDDLCIPFVPAFSKPSGHCFVIYFSEMPSATFVAVATPSPTGFSPEVNAGR
jgi:hypothetical protein